MRTCMHVVLAVALFSVPCHALVKTVGRGNSINFDPSAIPSSMKNNFDIMREKCVTCHTMERTVVAVTTGLSPITGQPFDRKSAQAHAVKLLRKGDSNMDKQQVKAVCDLVDYLLAEVAR